MTDSPAASAVEDLTAIPEFLDRRVEDGSTVASQPGMFEPLSPDEKAEAASASSRASSPAAELAPIVPVPDDAPPMRFRHPVHGEPSMTWPYHDADSGLVGYICRWDYTNAEGKPAKDYLPITYCDLGDGRQEWRAVGFPTPRPLYRLPKILARPDAPVLICEGEKTADAAAKLFPEMVATTPPHGAQSPHKADYAPLAGYQVLIWPDADQPGAGFARDVAQLARAAGAASVAIVDVPAAGGRRSWWRGTPSASPPAAAPPPSWHGCKAAGDGEPGRGHGHRCGPQVARSPRMAGSGGRCGSRR